MLSICYLTHAYTNSGLNTEANRPFVPSAQALPRLLTRLRTLGSRRHDDATSLCAGTQTWLVVTDKQTTVSCGTSPRASRKRRKQELATALSSWLTKTQHVDEEDAGAAQRLGSDARRAARRPRAAGPAAAHDEARRRDARAPPRAARGAQTAADVARGAAPRPRVPAARGPRGRPRPGGRAAAARAHARGVGRGRQLLERGRAAGGPRAHALVPRRAHRAEPAPGAQRRGPVQAAARPRVRRPRRRGELRAGQGGGALRPRAGLPLLDVRGLVDPAGDLARRRPRRARDPPAGARARQASACVEINQCVRVHPTILHYVIPRRRRGRKF